MTEYRKISPKQIYDLLSVNVVGQVEAKRAISNILFQHYVQIMYKHYTGIALKPNNFLLMGPSGNGKTLIVNEGVKAIRTLTGLDIMPLCPVDCTALTAEGWQGLNISDVLDIQYGKCSREAFSSTVMYFDEFDKLCSPMISSSGTDHHKQMQYALLTLVEGTDYNIERKGMCAAGAVNTSDFLFIFSGNFPEIRKNRDEEDKVFGFNKLEERDLDKKKDDLFQRLTKIGLATQLAGRISSVVEINALTKSELFDITMQLILPKAIDLYRFMGYTLHVPLDTIDSFVQAAHRRKTGARGIQAALNEYLQDILFEQKIDIANPFTPMLATYATTNHLKDIWNFNKKDRDAVEKLIVEEEREYTQEELDAMEIDPGMEEDYLEDLLPEDLLQEEWDEIIEDEKYFLDDEFVEDIDPDKEDEDEEE